MKADMDNANEMSFPHALGIVKITRANTAISAKSYQIFLGLFILEEISEYSHREIENLL
jgi:hypothetical protein